MRLVAVAVAFLLTSCATAPPLRDARFAPIRQKLQDAAAKDEFASISVAVAIDGRIVWEEAFGYANRESKVRATPQTQYAIASITKPVTATAIMKLVDDGKIDLSQPVVDILGPASIRAHADDASRVTVRSLLNHRSGMAEHNRYYFPGETRPPLDEILRRYAIVAYPVGQKYRYSNIGYAVLESIIERTSGQSYATFLRDSLFTPLRMQRTTVGPSSNAATLYDPDKNSIAPYDFASRGAGYVFSTPHDVVRFGLMHLGQPLSDQRAVLTEPTRRAMLTDRKTTGSATGRYGLDWYCGLGICGRDESEYGYAWYGHDGGMPGASARMKIVPSRGMVVVALSNSRQQLTYDIVDEILDVALPEYRERRAKDPALHGSPSPPASPALESIAGNWRGEVITSSATTPLSLVVESARVRMKIGEQAECVLEDLRFADGNLEGGCRATLPLDDVPNEPYEVWLDVELRDGAFAGIVSAYTPPPLYHFLLPAPVRLTRD